MSQAEILANTSVMPESKSEAQDKLSAMDRQADRVIAKWTFGGLAANLLPPPSTSWWYPQPSCAWASDWRRSTK